MLASGAGSLTPSAGGYDLEQSLRFNDNDTANLSRTPASAGNRKTWTFSTWFKVANTSSGYFLSVAGDATNSSTYIYTTADQLRVERYNGDGTYNFRVEIDSRRFRDPSAWYHLTVAFDSTNGTAADRIKIYINGELQTLSFITGSISLNSETDINDTNFHRIGGYWSNGSTAWDGYLSEVHFIDGTALDPTSFGETGTYGEWKPIEVTLATAAYGNNGFYLPFNNDYTVEGFSSTLYTGTGGAGGGEDLVVSGVGFKPGLVWLKNRNACGGSDNFVWDSVRGTGPYRALETSNNGSENMPNPYYDHLGSFNTDGFSLGVGTYTAHYVRYLNCPYIARCWDMGTKPRTGFMAVTYTGNDTSQKVGGVGFSPDLVWGRSPSHGYGLGVFDQVRGETEALATYLTDAEWTQSGISKWGDDGFTLGSTWGNRADRKQVAWCWDMGGVNESNTDGSITTTVRANPTYGQSIVSYTGTGSAATIGHGLDSAPDLIITKNRDATHHWWVHGKAVGTADSSYMLLQTNGALDTATNVITTIGASTISIDTNAHINTSGNDYIQYCFHSVAGYSKVGTYTGTGAANNSVTLGFKPAFLMVKKTNAAGNWAIWDNARQPMSTGMNEAVFANENWGDETDYNIDFTSNGFTLQASQGDVNGNNDTFLYMAFAGGTDSISDYNTTGTIDSRVKANPDYGQSVVSYTGESGAQTVGHGLSSAPEMVIVKNRSSDQEWLVYHTSNTSAPETDYLRLDTDTATGDNTFWNDTLPTTSVFSVGDSQPVNSGHGNSYIAYCFHSVSGYSKFGGYTGTASSNAITTGFTPAFVMIKRTNTNGEHWYMYDNVRDTDGSMQEPLTANQNSAESGNSSLQIDFTSTGFTLVGANAGINASNDTYIYMCYADKREAAFWLDQSGNNNDWTGNNLTESDISLDSPTNNFCNLNTLDYHKSSTAAPSYWSEGNLKYTHSYNYDTIAGTLGASSGKWYFEYTNLGAINTQWIGFANTGKGMGDGDSFRAFSNTSSWTYSSYLGQKWNGDGMWNATSYGEASWPEGSVIGCAIDIDAGKIWWSVNNTWQASGNPATGANAAFTTLPAGHYRPLLTMYNASYVANFGQDSSFASTKVAQGNQDGNEIGDFYYEPPSGFLALCTKNLPDPTVTPSEHFNTVLYTGNATNRTINGVGFAPDFVWLKARNSGYSHTLEDTVRGANKHLESNSTASESTASTLFTAFTSDGFTLGTHNNTNGSGVTMVGWNWKAGGAGVSNTDGTIASTVSVNEDAGFSIVKYTRASGDGAATIGHGLSKAPEMIIDKWRGDTSAWKVHHTGLTSGYELYLNDTDTQTAGSGLSTSGDTLLSWTNLDAQNHIAYCFRSVEGYSKVGSFEGNASTSGNFIYTGFTPALVILHNIDDGGGWPMMDNARGDYNSAEAAGGHELLRTNTSGAEGDSGRVDLLSNGFKPTVNYGEMNAAFTYVYIAFAESPFKHTNAR